MQTVTTDIAVIDLTNITKLSLQHGVYTCTTILSWNAKMSTWYNNILKSYCSCSI